MVGHRRISASRRQLRLQSIMVSITFDEFHAIRNRQRASANADAAADAASATETATKNSPSTSAGAANHTAAEESTNKAVKPRSIATTARGVVSPSESGSYSAESHEEEEGKADGRAAPASGSVRLSTLKKKRSAVSSTNIAYLVHRSSAS